MCQEAFAKTIAVQQIEYLRRAYARATDQIGLADEASVEAGRAVYRTIFAKDATFAVTGPKRRRYRQMVLMDGLTLCLVR